MDAAFECFGDRVGGIVAGEYDDRDVRVIFPNVNHPAGPGGISQAQIEDQNVKVGTLLQSGDGLLEGTRGLNGVEHLQRHQGCHQRVPDDRGDHPR
ncbi:MAG: hypothetical protein U5O39_12030 [Gammaproteobacteria bacterium]|nr:hypothetical protein [Gammaproteobacteria bacterium]